MVSRLVAALRKFLKLVSSRITRPSPVTCLECGFLALGQHEVTEAERCMLASRGSSAVMPNLESLHCHRSLWVTYDLTYVGNAEGPKLDEVNEQRHCRGFLRYKPGLCPDDHMQRLLRSEERGAQFKYVMLGLVLGSVLTLLATLVASWGAKYFGFK